MVLRAVLMKSDLVSLNTARQVNTTLSKTIVNAARDDKGNPTNGFTRIKEVIYKCLKSSHDDGSKSLSDDGKKVDKDPRKDSESIDQEKEDNVNSTNNVNIASSTVNAAGTNKDNAIYEVACADMSNLDTTIQVSPTPTIRINKDHPLDQVIGDMQSAIQTRQMSKNLVEHGFIGTLHQRTSHKDLQNFLFACFLSQEESKKKSRQQSTPIEKPEHLLKDEDGKEVNVHMYRSMIDSLMYLTSSRPDIMFAVCACTRYQVNLKVSHLHDVKKIFRYFKGQPKLGLWYTKDSPFDLVAYTNSDYAGASLDGKSTTGEAEYVAASSCRGQEKQRKMIIDKEKCFEWKFGVNAGDSKLMLLGINLLQFEFTTLA
ncbi:hypothetical protein Tco_0370519 [Tanacetum coccineum]